MISELNSMKQAKITIIASIFVIFFNPFKLYAQDLPLNTCQQIKDRIEHYGDLRKNGGSDLQMERWKISRTRARNEFRDNKCSKWKKKLK